MVSEIVKAECKKKNISLAELERKAQLGNGTIGKWTEETVPTIDVMIKIANVLKINVNVLIKAAKEAAKRKMESE